MKLAGDFLSRFNKLTPPNDALRRAVASSVSTILGVRIEKGQVRIQNSVAFVDVSSIQKHALRLERRTILDLVYEKIPTARTMLRDVR